MCDLLHKTHLQLTVIPNIYDYALDRVIYIYIYIYVYIQKAKIMASSPITSWQIDEETMETVTDFILLGSKITADGDCNHEIKRHLLLGRKALT